MSELRTWFDAHPLAEYESEIDGIRFIVRLSGHYYTQGDDGRHWECYTIQFPGVKASVDEEIPPHVVKAAWKRGKLVALQLQKDAPPESFEARK